MAALSEKESIDEDAESNAPYIAMPTEIVLNSPSADHPTPRRLSSHLSIRTLTTNEAHYLKQFIILGISQFSNVQLIVKCIDVLKQALRRNAIDDVISIILDVSSKGKSVNQDALLLCLVKCYMHDRLAVSKVILNLWRIPTQLFKSLMILRHESTEENNTETYYKSLLSKLSAKGQIPGSNAKKRQKRKPRGADTSNGIDERLRQPDDGESSRQPNEGESSRQPNEGEMSQDKKRKGNEEKKFISKHMKLIAKWYTDPNKSAEDLLLMLTKYPSRCDWNHHQLLRFSHPKIPEDDPEKYEKDNVLQYVLHGFTKNVQDKLTQFKSDLYNPLKCVRQSSNQIFKYIHILEEVKSLKSDEAAVAHIVADSVRHEVGNDIPYTFNMPVTPTPGSEDAPFNFPGFYESKPTKVSRFHLTVEVLPNEVYNYKLVWKELIKDMPMVAMLRHVSHISYLGLFDEQENVNYLKDGFTNEHRLFPFIHPFQILKALMAYKLGKPSHQHNNKQRKWDVNRKICEILNDAFHLSLQRKKKPISFDNCVICIDTSLPMTSTGFLGFSMFTATMISVAIATAIEQIGTNIRIFACGCDAMLLDSYPRDAETRDVCETLQERLHDINAYQEDDTNLSLPINQACESRTDVGAFILFTKSIESQYHLVKQAYKNYKWLMNRADTKLVICAMEACYIADTDNDGLSIVCGGDADVLVDIHLAINACAVGMRMY